MLRTLNAQPILWEAILPEMCLGMPAELQPVDRLLNDPAFFEPFWNHFQCCARASLAPHCDLPAPDVLEVPLAARVRAAVTHSPGPRWCRHLLAKAADAKGNGAASDYVVAKGVAKMSKSHQGALEAKGLASRTPHSGPDPDDARSGPLHRGQLAPPQWRSQRRGLDINNEMAAIASSAVKEAQRVAANVRRTLHRLGDAAPRRLIAIAVGLEVTASRVEQIATQTRQRIGGTSPEGATRLVSLHDPMPDRLKRAASASQWSSDTRPSWLITKTVSWSTTTSRGQSSRRAHASSGHCTSRQARQANTQGGYPDRGYGETVVDDAN